MSVLNIVKGSPLFYELYDEEILSIVEKCSVMSLEPGEAIFKDGENGDEIFLMLTGCAQVRKEGVNLAKLKKGDLFGELVLLNENIRNADIITEVTSDILVMKYSDIFNLYESSPKIFSILILNLARILAGRLKQAGEQIKDLKKAS